MDDVKVSEWVKIRKHSEMISIDLCKNLKNEMSDNLNNILL